MAKETLFTIEGIEEIQRAFAQLPKKVATKIIRKSVRESLRPMMTAVKALTPKKTGALARSTKIRAITKRKRGSIAIEVRQGERANQIFYGGFLNYGTKGGHSKRRKSTRGVNKGIKGRHYFEQAFEQTKDHVGSDVAKRISDGIAREAAALGLETK